jgi:hypothetical protein
MKMTVDLSGVAEERIPDLMRGLTKISDGDITFTGLARAETAMPAETDEVSTIRKVGFQPELAMGYGGPPKTDPDLVLGRGRLSICDRYLGNTTEVTLGYFDSSRSLQITTDCMSPENMMLWLQAFQISQRVWISYEARNPQGRNTNWKFANVILTGVNHPLKSGGSWQELSFVGELLPDENGLYAEFEIVDDAPTSELKLDVNAFLGLKDDARNSAVNAEFPDAADQKDADKSAYLAAEGKWDTGGMGIGGEEAYRQAAEAHFDQHPARDTEQLYREKNSAGGVFRVERWPEGIVVWNNGVIQWREWGPKAERPPVPHFFPGSRLADI